MKKFRNMYTDRKYEFISTKIKDDNYFSGYRIEHYWKEIKLEDGALFSSTGKGWYKTKIKESDLPESYLKYWNGNSYNYIRTDGVTDILYQPVLENHLFKDDSLYISYNGKIKILETQKHITEWYVVDTESYDERIWGRDLINFLLYAEKYSNYDISEIKEKIWNEKILWLKDNEPEFYVEREKFDSWFDKKENADIPYVVKKVF